MSDNKAKFLLTTTDNPYNPFTSWLEWYMEDLRLGHDTPGLIARIAIGIDPMNDDTDERAMRRIAELNLSGKHIIIFRDEFDLIS